MGWEELSDRVAHLERENRRLRRWMVAAVLVACACVVLGQSAAATSGPQMLEARRFVLKDAVGRERAVLGLGTDGLARLTFFSQDGSKGTSISEKPEILPVR